MTAAEARARMLDHGDAIAAVVDDAPALSPAALDLLAGTGFPQRRPIVTEAA